MLFHNDVPNKRSTPLPTNTQICESPVSIACVVIRAGSLKEKRLGTFFAFLVCAVNSISSLECFIVRNVGNFVEKYAKT